MRNVWLLTFVVSLFGCGVGLFLVALPQACLMLGMPSDNLGLVCTWPAVGYALSCIVLGQVCRRVRGKYVLITGIFLTLVSYFLISRATTVTHACLSSFFGGLGQGAFWPFASAWMLDFQSEAVPKTRILRHYNMAWTSGTAVGLFGGGWVCESGWVFETFLVSAGVIGLSALLAFVPTSTPAHKVGGEVSPSGPPVELPRTPGALLIAAITLNLVALGLRSTIGFNYAELNEFNQFGKDRMGLLTACIILGQMCAFGFGRYYEPYLGLRRMYFFIGLSLASIGVVFAYVQSLPALVCTSFYFGLILAMAFQTGILAATTYFKSPRTGTTVHESVIGVGTGSPILSGLLIQYGKDAHWPEIDALRAPYLAFAVLALVFFALQQGLITSQHGARVLLRPPAPSRPGAQKVDLATPLST